ncbi:hypothetical protein [Paraburkholderia pallida]|uniref:Uncharacterized protein n=1 Tax=Paraburkholderia pallida TaxID=2547399 RepID=A0A4P7D5C4_9BURK|nr:hypothetical protein [Paraburkholderia pallida]QBR03919.1 hypothetical protein E1956_42625 [Paraburkholderia pallida]
MAGKTLRLVSSQTPATLPANDRQSAGITAGDSTLKEVSVTPPAGSIPVTAEVLRPTPCFLVLRAGHECYVLDSDRDVIRRDASSLLLSFARRRGMPQPLEGASQEWAVFARTHEFSIEERKRPCMYSLTTGNETQRQLDLLASL